MTSFILSVAGYKTIMGDLEIEPTPVQFYRKPHDVEIISYDGGRWDYGGNGYRSGKVRQVVLNTQTGMPEVYRISDLHTSLHCGWIKLWRDLNPELGVNQLPIWDNSAWTNGTGFNSRYNCLTGENAGAADPAFHASIINGGAILQGTELDGKLWIKHMLNTDPVPSVQYVLDNWLWQWGVTVVPNGSNYYFTRKGRDGQYYPIRVPLVASHALSVPLTWLHKLDPGFIPDSALWKP